QDMRNDENGISRLGLRLGLVLTGKMLMQDKPRSLMERFHVKSLEDVFLQLCLEAPRRKSRSASIWERIMDSPQRVSFDTPDGNFFSGKRKRAAHSCVSHLSKIKAVIHKCTI